MIYDEYDIEAFKFIRKEIQLRINIHYKLLIYKLSFSAALFTFLNNSQTIKLSPFWLTAIFSFFFDIIIVENLGWVRNAGAYIKKFIENKMLDEDKQPMIYWEKDFTQCNNQWKCFTTTGYNLGVLSFSFIFVIGGFIFDFNLYNIFLIIITLFLFLYSQYLIQIYLGKLHSLNK